MGSTKELARQGVRGILNGGFSDELTITPTGESSVTINGTTSVHSLGFDSDGLPVIGPNSHATFSELDLTDLGVTTRDSNNNLLLQGWLIEWADQIGQYRGTIKELRPDRGLGIIVAILGEA